MAAKFSMHPSVYGCPSWHIVVLLVVRVRAHLCYLVCVVMILDSQGILVSDIYLLPTLKELVVAC